MRTDERRSPVVPLVPAPRGRGAAITSQLLEADGLACEVVADVDALWALIDDRAALALAARGGLTPAREAPRREGSPGAPPPAPRRRSARRRALELRQGQRREGAGRRARRLGRGGAVVRGRGAREPGAPRPRGRRGAARLGRSRAARP